MTRQINVRCGGCGRDQTFPATKANWSKTVDELFGLLSHKMDCYAPSVKVTSTQTTDVNEYSAALTALRDAGFVGEVENTGGGVMVLFVTNPALPGWYGITRTECPGVPHSGHTSSDWTCPRHENYLLCYYHGEESGVVADDLPLDELVSFVAHGETGQV